MGKWVPNALIIKGILKYFDSRYGTRIASIRPFCLPSCLWKTEQMPNLVKSGQGNHFASLDDLLRL